MNANFFNTVKEGGLLYIKNVIPISINQLNYDTWTVPCPQELYNKVDIMLHRESRHLLVKLYINRIYVFGLSCFH
jgi:hypothetical protein